MLRPVLALFIAALLVTSAAPVRASEAFLSDIVVRVDHMHITEAKMWPGHADVDFVRINYELEFGVGNWHAGIGFQDAHRGSDDSPGQDELGLMLLAGRDWVLGPAWRLDARTRIGLSPDTDPSQPLYAADTDLHVGILRSSPDGLPGVGIHRVHPSAYAATEVNRYGRVQLHFGTGVWFRNTTLYLTAYHSLNGVKDHTDAGDDFEHRFAKLANTGLTLSLGHGFGPFQAQIRRNFAGINAGNDLGITLSWQHYFLSEDWLP